MLLSLAVIGISAHQPSDEGTCKGQYSGGSLEDFERMEDISVYWMPDAMEKLNLKDGNMEDWAALGIQPTVITPANMVSWLFHDVPEGFQITVYFLADSDYLYVGFYIVDPEVFAANPDDLWNYSAISDCFQINIDFGRKLGWTVENDPDTTELLLDTYNVFYSFAYNGEGGRVGLNVRNCENDRILYEEDGVIGSTGRTDDGWCAEFTIPFQTMYDDYLHKLFLKDDEKNAVVIDEDHPFTLGAGIYYLNQGTKDGVQTMTWASGIHSGYTGTDKDGQLLDPATNPPLVCFDVYDNAMSLVLDYVEGMDFNCTGMLTGDQVAETTVDTDPAETDPVETNPVETDSVDSGSAESTVDSVADTTGDTDAGSSADTVASDDETGCSSVVSFAAVAVVTAAVAFVLKKKD